VPLLNLQKSRVFKFTFLTNVFGEDFSRPPAGKIYIRMELRGNKKEISASFFSNYKH
jgi:hypothetical protein